MTRAARDPLASCQGKERFETYSMAAHVAHRPSRRNQLRPAIYHCAQCGGFHIGNNKPKLAKADRRKA